MNLATARHSTLAHVRSFYFRRMVEDGVPGICRSCYCTDRRPCPSRCSWADSTRTLCTACSPDQPFIVIATH